jgi:hypothetical protein
MDGELYDATGSLYSCDERLCPGCLSKRSRKARRRARGGLASAGLRRGELLRFVTLTMPTLPASEVPLELVLKVIQTAWRTFSNRRGWWSSVVRAGVKGVEFTLGNPKRLQREGREWTPERDGYHVHLHLVAVSRWIEWRRLREEWSACLLTAWREHGIERGINTSDGLAVCDVRLVFDKKRKSKSFITTDGAVNEVCKYVTKCESWLHVPESQLVEIASVERWPRMFELLGDCRQRAEAGELRRVRRSREEREAEAEAARLAELRHAEAVRLAEWLEADPRTVDAAALFGGDPQDAGDWRGRASADALTYLDTTNLFDGEHSRDGPIYQRRRRAKSLREVGAEMIAQGEREKWKEGLAAYAADVRSFRRSQQVWRYPFASFSDLIGGRWYGLRAKPASVCDVS